MEYHDSILCAYNRFAVHSPEDSILLFRGFESVKQLMAHSHNEEVIFLERIRPELESKSSQESKILLHRINMRIINRQQPIKIQAPKVHDLLTIENQWEFISHLVVMKKKDFIERIAFLVWMEMFMMNRPD